MELFDLNGRVAIVTGSSKGIGKAIALGLIKTDFAKTLWTDPVRLARVENLLPPRRIGDPDDIAGAAVFLASQAAAFLTGQVLNLDGGNAVV